MGKNIPTFPVDSIFNTSKLVYDSISIYKLGFFWRFLVPFLWSCAWLQSALARRSFCLNLCISICAYNFSDCTPCKHAWMNPLWCSLPSSILAHVWHPGGKIYEITENHFFLNGSLWKELWQLYLGSELPFRTSVNCKASTEMWNGFVIHYTEKFTVYFFKGFTRPFRANIAL